MTKSAKVKVPRAIDWRRRGAVSRVKFQGANCSSCWAFVATGALEAQNFRKTGKLVPLSEQNLIDCSNAYGNRGCNYGWAYKAFDYIRDIGGIESEKNYPYVMKKGKCKFSLKRVAARSRSYVAIPNKNEKKLTEAIGTIGPVAAQIDSSPDTFQHYAGGIYYEPKCDEDKTDHAVLIVGYGRDNKRKIDFYIVKNTWGPDWGEKGYIRMIRNRNNSCGIASFGFYPTL